MGGNMTPPPPLQQPCTYVVHRYMYCKLLVYSNPYMLLWVVVGITMVYLGNLYCKFLAVIHTCYFMRWMTSQQIPKKGPSINYVVSKMSIQVIVIRNNSTFDFPNECFIKSIWKCRCTNVKIVFGVMLSSHCAFIGKILCWKLKWCLVWIMETLSF